MISAQPSITSINRGEISRGNFRSRKGLSMFEAMIAVLVFTMGMLGVYMMLIRSYEMVTLCRHRDNARAVLQSFGDQFQRLKTTDDAGNLGFIFQTAPTPTSFGLSWTDANNVTVSNLTTNTDTAGLPITLGDVASSAIPARVYRQVQPLAADGSVVANPIRTAAGYMLQGTFTVTYQIKNKPVSQSIVVARSYR
ncbi:MAG: hypothetical protein JWM32_994 [Verrucomicrobia bacterium]|nr:hypothetical protein [Verrucomicrobiota bacterium]